MKWQQHAECSFGNRCNFAHGSDELRVGSVTVAPASEGATKRGNSSASEESSPTASAESETRSEQQMPQQQM
jgi:hypothetical protein